MSIREQCCTLITILSRVIPSFIHFLCPITPATRIGWIASARLFDLIAPRVDIHKHTQMDFTSPFQHNVLYLYQATFKDNQ